MRTSTLITLILASALNTALASASSPWLLEVVRKNGPGETYADIVVAEDGSVSDLSRTPVTIIAKLDATVVAGIRKTAAGVSKGDLVRLNPAQNYNAGGFTAAYFAKDADGKAFLFAKNVSGVDFGVLTDRQESFENQDLRRILEGLSTLALEIPLPVEAPYPNP